MEEKTLNKNIERSYGINLYRKQINPGTATVLNDTGAVVGVRFGLGTLYEIGTPIDIESPTRTR